MPGDFLLLSDCAASCSSCNEIGLFKQALSELFSLGKWRLSKKLLHNSWSNLTSDEYSLAYNDLNV